MHKHSQQYPEPPWRLKGCAFLRLQMLPVELVRPWVPPALKIVSVLPGRTVGALYLASYEAGSSLRYHELIVAPAAVRHGALLGGWISHIYVDSHASVAGGREIWALPKQIAQFQWEADAQGGQVTVTQGAQVLCSLRATAPGPGVRAPIYAPVLSSINDRLIKFRGTGSTRLSIGHGEIDIPRSSALAPFEFASGRQLLLNALDLKMSAPEVRKHL